MNEAGVRAKNQWVSIENEDGEEVNGDEVDTLWYYFGDNGKAYKGSGSELKKKTCPDATGSRTYFFDESGHMVSGWVTYDYTSNGKSKTDTYYCGTENEGWAYTGWQYLETDDDIFSKEYDDQEWFFFKSSGVMKKATDVYYKGRYYTLNDEGVMTSDWYDLKVDSLAISSYGVASVNNSEGAYTSESGTKGTGWVYAEDADGVDSHWYYLVSVKDTNNDTYRNVPFNSLVKDSTWRAKVIKSKTYIFDNDGKMKTGLVAVGMPDVNGSDYTKVDTSSANSLIAGAVSKKLDAGYYYFNGANGSVKGQMMTGKVTIEDDGDTYHYYFEKSTGKAALNTVKDGVVYGPTGDRIQADDGNTNMIYHVDADITYGKYVIKAGSDIIVSSTGKLRTSGKGVKVDGVKYDITSSTTSSGTWKVDPSKNQD